MGVRPKNNSHIVEADSPNVGHVSNVSTTQRHVGNVRHKMTVQGSISLVSLRANWESAPVALHRPVTAYRCLFVITYNTPLAATGVLRTLSRMRISLTTLRSLPAFRTQKSCFPVPR